MNADTTTIAKMTPEDSFRVFATETLVSLIRDVSLREYLKRVRLGLKAPPGSGEYRYARQQVLRLWAPVTGIILPVIGMIVILLVPRKDAAPTREIIIELPDPPKALVAPEPVRNEERPVVEHTSFQNDAPAPYIEPATPDDSTAGQQGLGVDSATQFGPKPLLGNTAAFSHSIIKARTVYTARSREGRGKGLDRYSHGLGGMTEDAVMRALRWLKRTQSSDGSWPQTKPAMTGLALLAFLAHNETTDSREFGYTVEKAIQFLVSAQQPDGHFAGRDAHDYSHPIATYALCEAYGMTGLPQVKDAAKRALLCVVQGQHAGGGFNYNLNADNRDDTSYMAWCAQAMKAGDIAYVMEEPEKLRAAMRKAIEGFKRNYRDKGESGYAQGGFGYTSPDIGGLTGAGALCLQLLGAARDREVKASLETMKDWAFEWNSPTYAGTIYYAYYTTQVKFHEEGPQWTAWNRQFATALAKNQTVIPEALDDSSGKPVAMGFWDSTASGYSDGGEGKRVMTTCLCTLMLEVYYRYLPTYAAPQEITADGDTPGANRRTPKEVRIDTNGV
jgi:hypothetical protein